SFGEVDVVVEEDVAGLHRLEREVPRHRMHERRVRTTGALAQVAVVDAGPEVVGVADHRRARGPGDGGLHLHLDTGEVAGDDLDQHRIGSATRSVGQPEGLAGRGRGGFESRSHRVAPFESDVLLRRMLPKVSMRARNPGWTGMVELNSSITAGTSR